jgi:hypothetical protein
MKVRSAIEQEGDDGVRAADDGPVERMTAGAIDVVDEGRLGIEKRSNAV